MPFYVIIALYVFPFSRIFLEDWVVIIDAQLLYSVDAQIIIVFVIVLHV